MTNYWGNPGKTHLAPENMLTQYQYALLDFGVLLGAGSIKAYTDRKMYFFVVFSA